jgi:hypothetical protein
VSRWSAAGAVPLAVVRVRAVQRAGYRRSAAGLGIFVASGIGAAALWAPPAEPFDGFLPALEAPGDVLLPAVVACLGLAAVPDAGDVDPDDGARAFAALEAEPWLVDAPILGGFALIGVGVVALLARAPWPHALRAVPGGLDTTVLVGITVLSVRQLRIRPEQ